MIVDSSIVLAVLFAESKAKYASELLNDNVGSLSMSVINVTECLMRIGSQVHPSSLSATLKVFREMPIERISADERQAEVAALARLQYSSLNFGDCFGYALAKLRAEPILTLDEDFLSTDLVVIGVSRR